MTLLSLLLEIFCHVFVSIGTSFGYMIYFLNPKFMHILINFTGWSDAGGLFAGSIYGKTPFARSISPTKTVEGFLGAIGLPVFVACLFYISAWLTGGYISIRMPFFDYVFLGISLGLCAVMGDLIESFIKRCANVKDSGMIFKSHGGALDRVDSLCISAPFLYWYTLEYLNYAHSPNYDFNDVHIFAFLKFHAT